MTTFRKQLALRGLRITGSLSILDFSSLADVQCGSINIDQDRKVKYRVILNIPEQGQ